jgi:very-short-patch-repair endonuclease
MRGVHKLTPIEAPFYDAMKETELTFAVQPRVQGPDQMFRPDFIVFYGGRAVVVEIDGHEGHKTREQRSHDAARERWFQQRGMPVVRFTGSQVWADAGSCVEELLSVLRGSSSRP